MSPSRKSLQKPTDKAVLLSIKPTYSQLIIAGEKRVEFRRAWAALPVSRIAIYSSSPCQRIVGMAEVTGVIVAPPAKLWELSEGHGRGITKKLFMEYFTGKALGTGVLLGAIHIPPAPLKPQSIIRDFTAPQSFRYLSETEIARLTKQIGLPQQQT